MHARVRLQLWRPNLRREPQTSLLRCLVCLLAVFAGLVGFVVLRPMILAIAGLYFVGATAVVYSIIYLVKASTCFPLQISACPPLILHGCRFCGRRTGCYRCAAAAARAPSPRCRPVYRRRWE